ncbi:MULTISPECIES: efflux RND transporter periplasmic adaptor subunit [Roseivirga]|jgi:multidrug efflux pump subunit AcrA (membrane-fusion protein)|uniref:efflux RND transporter periplasmic adaptor subunit n=1 Tax=Roseivirga TaxID=290180 RepID=UPI000A06972F|nr:MULTISPECIES: efflux RND transporter periplasmic adaptor subunit [Roseivirga]MBO6497482.1 efflux RND transporter periplasmic adaptor subunit [Roseivirga sp.]MBO6662093.1 efflux RND transporter periplasmic adaptor subunit [Roseivirga sp.]MBO6910411.1 efflux RND transporter periplasmic adaptor subunit [Roseivirga sp.]WPZ12315.1 efflux RND transporter periplasmic adaptor subunit [Roseivirga spongicola]
MKKKLIIFGVVVVTVIIVAATVFNPSSAEEGPALFTTAERGEFTVEVTSTGELSAERSTKIMGPLNAREYGIRQISVQRLVEEGTQVREGDFVAQLDPSELYDKIQQEKDQLDAQIAEFDNAKIDTALTLRAERDKLINLDYQIEEKQLQLDQSQYEPPATIKKYENELEKLQRDKVRAKEEYQLKIEQAKAKMIEETSDLRRRQNRYDDMQEVLSDFTIMAPQAGMVIYTKMGSERVVEGSQINVWSPEVAELPDLSSMISTTFINEVDIRKVKVGQQVEIGLDAFPEKRLTGRVTRVARVGQQNPNSDAKVFEVIARVNERDGDLRPAMTTSNIIITQKLEDVVYVPLECLNTYNDSINYVIKKNGTLQEVKVGLTNSNEAVIEMGVEEGDVLYLSRPEGIEGKEPKLIPELNGTRNQKYEVTEPENMLDDSKWVLPNGQPMSEDMIQRLKDRGITDPSQLQNMMNGRGGSRGGQRPQGGSGAARSGQAGN